MKRVRAGDRLAQLCCGFVVAAVVLGGGGSPHPLPELLLQLVVVVVAFCWLAVERKSDFGRNNLAPVSPVLLILAFILLALPLLQLVPLPPSAWQSLPGRETERLALTLIGREDSWRPLALSPSRTLASLLALGPPLLAMLLIARLDLDGRAKVLAAIAAMALVSAILGVLQASGSSGAFQFYDTSHHGWATGFQANRNAMADILLIGILATGVTAARWSERLSRPIRLGATLAATLVLTIVTILTGSRTGIALLLVVIPLQALLMLKTVETRLEKQIAVALALAIVLALASAYVLADNVMIGRSADRFALGEDPRHELWADTRFAIDQLWPFGAGIGNFTPTLVAIERLEIVDPSWPNRAHNDYLEFALEAGVPGVVILAAVAVTVLGLAIAAWKNRRQGRETVLFSLGTFAVIGLHSLVDYPLRSMALSVLTGAAVGLLAPSSHLGQDRRHTSRKRLAA